MQILPLSSPYNAAYGRFLKSIEASLLYGSLKYRDFLIDLLGCEATYWLCMDNGEIVGVLPAMTQEGPYGRILNSLPFYGSNGGILAQTPEAFNALANHFNSLLDGDGYAAATLISNPLAVVVNSPSPASIRLLTSPMVAASPSRREATPLLEKKYFPSPLEGEGRVGGGYNYNLEQCLKYDVTDARVGQFIRLTERKDLSFEAFCRTIDSSTRRNIKKAQSAGFTVRVDNTAFDFLYDCHVENMADMGGNAKSRRCFELIQKHFVAGEDYNLYIAEKEGVPVSALLLFYYHQTVEYFTPVTRAEFRTEQPMALILYQAITEAANRGYLWWNWGGTWLTQEGVYRFKKKWGSLDLPYTYYTKINNKVLCRMEKSQLLEAYDGFYVLPFHILENPVGVTV